MILADSGYLIALAKPRDALHSRAVAWSRLIDEPLLVPECVLWETVNFLSPLRDRTKAQTLVEQVLNTHPFAFVPAAPELFAAGLRLHRERPDKEWSLTDCVSFHLMRERGLTRAMAYDIHFEQAGFEALLRRDPPA